ncbi:MAG: helix-turn-helix transcriptional regulator [Opitutaceae bacterium]|nr:helix-turn-helix transcriptional regulator [Cytophagales bacterium]
MEIGTSIKTIRKRKGISQKELADQCGISTNALCQIELNNTLPQKSTIKIICEKLGVPISYILYFSLTEEDVPEGKRKMFNSLNNLMKDVLFEG